MKYEKYKKGFGADYKKFFSDHELQGVRTRTAAVFFEMLYEWDPVGGMDDRERCNRH